jgi:Holliday junction DNA helicase RuvB
MFDDDGHHLGALEAGAAYALLRHGQDVQTRQIINAIPQAPVPPTSIDVHVHLDDDEDDRTIQPINALDFATADMPESWDDYIGQGPLKRRLQVAMKSAQARGEALPHILLASGLPGVGKTAMARLIAKTMDVDMIEMVPPFNVYSLVAALETLLDHDVCFIDEIHLLAMKRLGGEMLLKVLEDKVAFIDGEAIKFNDFTIIGATTDKDLLSDPVLQRFKIRPYFQPYSLGELSQICVQFAFKHDADQWVDNDLTVDIAGASRGTPRILEEMVIAARDLALTFNRAPSTVELFEYVEVEPDGLTRTDVHYLTAMRKYFARMTKDEGIEYIVGEAAIMQILRETKQGIGRVERFLIERGLIDRTPRGRRLTDRGIARAEQFIREGKGPSDIA